MNTYKIRRMMAASLSVMLLACGCGSVQEQDESSKPGDVQIDTEIAEPETKAETADIADTADAATDDTVTEEKAPGTEEPKPVLEDGTYYAVFDTDSSMFHVNEACEGRGKLTVAEGVMTMHLIMPSKNVVNLFYGLMEDAQKDGAELIEPTTETVTYPDGTSEEVFAFDIPVPYLDETFDLALIGTKGKWYDHKVSVSDPVAGDIEKQEAPAAEELQDGGYSINVTLEGGSGRAGITSPAVITIDGGQMFLRVEWSSPNYDYMIADGVKYEPVNTEGNSVFEIPVNDLSQPLNVIADTTAMSVPHEIEYTISFDPEGIIK